MVLRNVARCEHHWHYDFRVNGRRYRASTETHDKRQPEDIEARERSRILDGHHGIRRQPDITFKAFAEIYLRDHADLHKTEKPYTTIRKVFERALERAKITTGDVTVHTLRHTALSRMIEHGLDDHTVMSISGHSSTRMLERYTPPTVERKRAALETFDSLAQIGHKYFPTMPYKEKSRPKTTFS